MSMRANQVTGAAFAEAFSLITGAFVEVEIVGVPYVSRYVSRYGSPVVDVWVPSVEGRWAYTTMDYKSSGVTAKTRLARELLKLVPEVKPEHEPEPVGQMPWARCPKVDDICEHNQKARSCGWCNP